MRVNELLEQGEAGSAMAQRLLSGTVEQLRGTAYFEGEAEGTPRYNELLAVVEREFEASFLMRTETARGAARAALDSGALSVACSAAAAAAAAAMGAGADQPSSLEAGAAAAREVDAELRLMGDEHHLLGTRSYRDGNAQAAADRFTAAVAVVPGHAGFLESRATALNALGRHAEAEHDCRLAIQAGAGQAGPARAHALAQLGHALVGQGRFRAAVDEGFKLAIRADPQDADFVKPHMAMAEQLAQQAARLPPDVDPATLVVGAKRKHAQAAALQQQQQQQPHARAHHAGLGVAGGVDELAPLLPPYHVNGAAHHPVAGAADGAGGKGKKAKKPKPPPRATDADVGAAPPGMYPGYPVDLAMGDQETPVPIPKVIPKVNKDWKNKVYPRRKPQGSSPPPLAGEVRPETKAEAKVRMQGGKGVGATAAKLATEAGHVGVEAVAAPSPAPGGDTAPSFAPAAGVPAEAGSSERPPLAPPALPSAQVSHVPPPTAPPQHEANGAPEEASGEALPSGGPGGGGVLAATAVGS